MNAIAPKQTFWIVIPTSVRSIDLDSVHERCRRVSSERKPESCSCLPISMNRPLRQTTRSTTDLLSIPIYSKLLLLYLDRYIQICRNLCMHSNLPIIHGSFSSGRIILREGKGEHWPRIIWLNVQRRNGQMPLWSRLVSNLIMRPRRVTSHYGRSKRTMWISSHGLMCMWRRPD